MRITFPLFTLSSPRSRRRVSGEHNKEMEIFMISLFPPPVVVIVVAFHVLCYIATSKAIPRLDMFMMILFLPV
jgi:hypothetical protein